MVKLVDVARAAGVSVATVSRTLNGNDRVDPELAERVRAAARELDYRPNAVARALRRQGSQAWALVVTDVNNPFYTAVARGVEDLASASGYSVLLCNSDEDPEKESRYLEVAEAERVSGVIIAPSSTDTDVSRLLSARIPVVAIDRHLKTPVVTVSSQSRRGSRHAVEHLLEHGWQRPACVTGPVDAETAVDRAEGYLEVVRERGLPELLEHVPYHAPGGVLATEALLALPEPPDCFFVANSVLALGVIETIKAKGLVLGRDVGLITFDDAPWAPLLDPPITVVAQPAYAIGTQAAKHLLARLDGAESTEQDTVFETSLIERESCRRHAR